MNWELIFSVTNIWALVAWAVLLLAPRRPAVLSAVMYLGVGLLCFVYAVLMALLLSGSVTSGGDGGSGMDFTTLSGVMAVFASPGGTTIGWTHYLALDLFAGLWVARDADAKSVSRLWQTPFLLMTAIMAPVGLLLWLVFRERRARAAAR
jgi:hypothetical protein